MFMHPNTYGSVEATYDPLTDISSIIDTLQGLYADQNKPKAIVATGTGFPVGSINFAGPLSEFAAYTSAIINMVGKTDYYLGVSSNLGELFWKKDEYVSKMLVAPNDAKSTALIECSHNRRLDPCDIPRYLLVANHRVSGKKERWAVIDRLGDATFILLIDAPLVVDALGLIAKYNEAYEKNKKHQKLYETFMISHRPQT